MLQSISQKMYGMMRQMVSIRFLNLIEKAFFTLTLFLLTDNFSRFINFSSRHPYIRHAVGLFTDTPVSENGKVIRAWLTTARFFSIDVAFWLALLLLLLRPGHFVKILRVLWNNVAIVALLLLAGTSWFWSIDPNNTLNGFLFILKITFIGIYISQTYSLKEIMHVLVGVIALASILSILAIWQTPALGVNGRYWQGVYSFKNFLGRLMAFGNALLIIYWFSSNWTVRRGILALALFILTGILLIFSDSATSIVVWVSMCGALILYGIWRKWNKLFSVRVRRLLVLFGALSAIPVVMNYELIFTLFKRSSTLSGRTVLWEILCGWFKKRPIFGFGHDAFWQVFPDDLTLSGQVIRHAHNGYIEIALGLGLLGLIIFLVSLVVVWKRSFLLLRQKQQILYFWPTMALIYFTLANVTYSIAFENPGFHWALFIIVAGAVTFDRLPERSFSRETSDHPAQAIRESHNLP